MVWSVFFAPFRGAIGDPAFVGVAGDASAVWCGAGSRTSVAIWDSNSSASSCYRTQANLLMETTKAEGEGTLNTNNSERTDVLAMQISLSSNSQKRTYQLFLVHVSLHYCAESPICHVDTYRKMLNL
jgi:hypothetical protein